MTDASGVRHREEFERQHAAPVAPVEAGRGRVFWRLGSRGNVLSWVRNPGFLGLRKSKEVGCSRCG